MPFSEKQEEFFQSASRRWNFKVGATRSGKTYMDYFLIPKRIRRRVGEDGLAVVLGVTKSTIERNVLEPMRNLWGDDLVGKIGSNNTCQLFGERVHCLGAEKVSQVSKLRGTSIKYAYGDEVADWSKDVFELLKSRLDTPNSCFDGTLNPQSPNHWLKKFLESDADVYCQHYTIFDNPFLPEDFVQNLCKEYEGTVYYKRYILGEWAMAEGLIYPMYEEAIGMPEKGERPTEYCLSIDYGTMNAFAALLWEKHKDAWYAVKEYYYSGRDNGKTKTDEEYGEELDKFVGELKDLETIIDPSAASFIALLRKRKGKYRVKAADNAVADGIRQTATALNTGKIKICPNLENWKAEAGGYVWEENDLQDRPIKLNDHLMDAMRYFVKTKRISVVEESYKSAFGG